MPEEDLSVCVSHVTASMSHLRLHCIHLHLSIGLV
jgi:hypothetical protein